MPFAKYEIEKQSKQSGIFKDDSSCTVEVPPLALSHSFWVYLNFVLLFPGLFGFHTSNVW